MAAPKHRDTAREKMFYLHRFGLCSREIDQNFLFVCFFFLLWVCLLILCVCVCVDFVVVVDVVLGGSRKYTPIMGLTERPSLGKKKKYRCLNLFH